MKHIQKIILIALGFMFSAAFATTAVVDVKSIIESTDIMKTTAAEMEKTFTPKRDELMAMQKTLETDTKKLSKDKSVMKASDVEALSKKIADTQKTLMDKEQAFRTEVFKAQNEAIQKAMDQVKSAAAKVAKVKGIDTVLASGEVLYIDAKNDITTDVKKLVTKK
ncbi:MAG: OmpH family outer membrane protein [Gammaproteobacteria bacterium]|nr:OmpH family outer membrane protein [Gammaproteobacteria bacterium]